jgi:hypothetical protein
MLRDILSPVQGYVPETAGAPVDGVAPPPGGVGPMPLPQQPRVGDKRSFAAVTVGREMTDTPNGPVPYKKYKYEAYCLEYNSTSGGTHCSRARLCERQRQGVGIFHGVQVHIVPIH